MKFLKSIALTVLLLSVAAFAATYTSKDGKFSVNFPAEPQITHQSSMSAPKTGEPVPVEMTFYTARAKNGDALLVMTGDAPSTAVLHLDWVAESVAGETGTLVFNKDTTFQGNPAKNFIVDYPKTDTEAGYKMVILAIAQGARLYEIGVVTDLNASDEKIQAARSFINSFNIN